jgi:hypothetical protein
MHADQAAHRGKDINDPLLDGPYQTRPAPVSSVRWP